LRIRIDRDKINTLQAFVDHTINGVAPTASYADYFDSSEGFDLIGYTDDIV
jgi:hypothetical protein